MIAAASLLLQLAASAHGATAPAAAVWLPSESFARWSEVDGLLRSRPELVLTVALTPAQASPLVKAALGPWVERGRVEIAVRAPGDPWLTWACSRPSAPRPQDAAALAVKSAAELREKLGIAPTGFAPGAGALDAALAGALAPAGLGWVLAGPYAPVDGPWAAASRTALVPAQAAPQEPDASWLAPGASVFDETASTSPASSFLTAVARLSGRPSEGWVRLSELVAARPDRVPASAVADWPAWDPAAALPPADEGAARAWDLYGEAAAAVERYQNSGSADLRQLDAAVEELRRAQASRHYRPGADPAPLRTALRAVYKRLKLPAPDELFAEDDSAGAAGDATAARVSAGKGWLELRNPERSLALAPALRSNDPLAAAASTRAAAFADGGAAADPWRLRSLRVEWNDATVRLILKSAAPAPDSPKPAYEVYIDLNRVLGAGRVPMLEGRGAAVSARDAWEFAVTMAGSRAKLFRAGTRAEPEEIGEAELVPGEAPGEYRASFARSALRGNPSRWGWSVVSFAEDPERAGRWPPAALVAPDGTILLGSLGSLETQKSLLGRTNSRLPALRLEPGG